MTIQGGAYLRLKSQLLTDSTASNAHEVVSHLGMIQSQDYKWFTWSIGMRLAYASIKGVAEAISSGSIVRSHLFRCTVQTVSSEDYWPFLELCMEGNLRKLKSWQSYIEANISEQMFSEACAVFMEIMANGASLTKQQIASRLSAYGFPADEAHIRQFIVMAEVTGVIASGRMDGRFQTWTLTEGRLTKPIKPHNKAETMAQLARKYFRSHGPATIEDFCWWTGLPKSMNKNGVELIANELQEIEIDNVPMLVHKDCVAGNVPSSPSILLLPPYDEYLIGYKSRHLAVESSYKHVAYNSFGIFKPVILLNGRVCGNWQFKALSNIKTDLFRYKSRISSRKLNSEVNRVLAFYTPDGSHF